MPCSTPWPSKGAPKRRLSKVPERSDEFGIIERFFAPLAVAEAGAFGLTDDAAVLTFGADEKTAITTDCLIAGVHFLDNDPPGDVAAKMLAVNLSDLAAMGARPKFYTLAAAWPKPIDIDWIEKFARGLGEAQAEAGVVLVGGDTVAGPGPLTLTLTAIGVLSGAGPLLRGGVRPGDRIYVSGTIGDAALGLRVLSGELEATTGGLDRDYLIARYRRPQARNRLGLELTTVATAAVDISDGLVADVNHLAQTSNLSITIRAADIPLSEAVRSLLNRRPELLSAVLTGGDDYELLFSAPPDIADRIATLRRAVDVPITEIGHADAGPGRTVVVDGEGKTVPVSDFGYRHF